MTELEEWKKAAGDLATELARMHAALFILIADLRATELSAEQEELVNAADRAWRKSQREFLAEYAEEIGGANPERN
jgi:nicotinamide mononucleotide adenylyltransferase